MSDSSDALDALHEALQEAVDRLLYAVDAFGVDGLPGFIVGLREAKAAQLELAERAGEIAGFHQRFAAVMDALQAIGERIYELKREVGPE